jgi:precorrin-8X/cobalt-precorrin-8 methylmutase
MRPYEKNPAAIHAAARAAVRAQAALDRFPMDVAEVVLRVIQACGMPEAADRMAFAPEVAASGIAALRSGARVHVDCAMVAAGITRRLLPRGVRVCGPQARPDVPMGGDVTRAAAAVDPWDLDGAVVAIGTEPTALFRLLERLDAGAPRPAAILAFPVGFVGAAEAKAELAANPRGSPFLTLRGRRGGAAMAAAAVDALAVLAAGGVQ